MMGCRPAEGPIMDATERQPETAARVTADTADAKGTLTHRRPRFQYSLATLMWVVTLTACLCALLVTYCRMESAEAEVRKVCPRRRASTPSTNQESNSWT